MYKEELYLAQSGQVPSRDEVMQRWCPFDHPAVPIGNPIFVFNRFWEYVQLIGNREITAQFRLVVLKELMDKAKAEGSVRYTPTKMPVFPIQMEMEVSREVERQRTVLLRSLIPKIEEYITLRGHEPMVPIRLSWIIDQVSGLHTPGRRGGYVSELLASLQMLSEREWPTPASPEPSTLTAIPTGTPEPQLPRLKWQGSTIEFVTIFKNLIKFGYVDLPSTGGKEGEGNIAEYLRRLQRAFVVNKDDESELNTEGLADRWRGRRMGGAREQQFDIPEATRKRPSS